MTMLGAIDYEKDQMKQAALPGTPEVVKQPPPAVILSEGDAKLYKSNMQSWKYVFRKGTVATFINGQYATNKPHEIAELDEEISYGHPNILFDPDEPTAKSNAIMMMQGLREKFYREFQAEQQAAAVNPDNDMGSSEQGKLNVTSTRDIASAAAGGSGATPGAATKSLLPLMTAPK